MPRDMTPDVRKSLTGREWGLVLLLAAINFTHMVDFVIVMPLGDALRQQLGINPQQFGFIVSAYGLAAMVAGVVASSTVDRFDRKAVLLTGFAGFVLATVYCGLAPDYWNLLIARGLAGLFGGISGSTVMAIIGDVIPDQRRGRAIGVVTSSFAVASTIGIPIGLTLAAQFHHWNVPFFAIAGVGVPVWLLACWQLPTLTGHQVAGKVNPITQFIAVVKQPNHFISLFFMLATVLGLFIIVPFMMPYLQANCGRSASDPPFIYAVAGICSLFMMNLIGYLTDRVGARRMFLITATGSVIMTIVFTNLPSVNLITAIAATTAFMLLATGRIVPAQAMMLRSADPKLRGAFMNLNTAVSHLGTATGPIISGAIIGEQFKGGPLTHYWLAGLIAAGFGITALGLSFLLRPAPMSVPLAEEVPTILPPNLPPAPFPLVPEDESMETATATVK